VARQYFAHLIFPGTLLLLLSHPATAQIVVDGSLGSNVTGCPVNCLITGGQTAGSNLFHSFSQFSIPTGGAATFDPQPLTSRIFSRVTGGVLSQINGELRVNGGADLFLVNPAGIQFGPNARLNMIGSFIGTTAQTIDFGEGEKFGLGTNSLLSIKVPVGLEIYGNQGSIQVDGIAPPLPLAGDPRFTPTIGAGTPAGLSTPGKTLGLVGNGITINQAALTGANISIHSSNGYVSLMPAPDGYSLTGDRTADLTLTNLSRIDASQQPTNRISLSARNLEINQGSQVLIQSVTQPPGSIDVVAQTLNIRDLNGVYASRIVTEHFGLTGSTINVEAGNINLIDGGQISTRGYGPGPSGAITINSSSTIRLANPNITDPLNNQHAIIISDGSPLSGAAAGPIKVTGKSLILQSGGAIVGEKIAVHSDDILVEGLLPNGQPSSIFSNIETLGNIGSLDIQAINLTLQNRGTIGSNTSSLENAGDINIRTQTINVFGIPVAGITSDSNATGIGSVAGSPLFNSFFGRVPGKYGQSGNIAIITNLLNSNWGVLSSANVGSGSAGKVFVEANRANFDNSVVYSSAFQGNGGGIVANIKDLRGDSSFVYVNSDGSGLGGNIDINSDTVLGRGNTFLATSFGNRGGRIQVNAAGIFLGRDTRVSVSSGLGPEFSGQSILNASDADTLRNELRVASINQLPEVVKHCPDSDSSSSLVDLSNTTNPFQQKILGNRGWQPNQPNAPSLMVPQFPPSPSYQDAQGWEFQTTGAGKRIGSMSAFSGEK
jgi:filamentous hemagglutinin family protein